MSKSKSTGAKDTKPSAILNKVKAAAVTKPAQSMKTKNKELAKQVAVKEEKKSKKKVKEPTPEPSSESEEDSDESESDSETEVEAKGVNGKTNGAKVVAPPSDESEEDSDESDSDSEVEAPATNGAAKVSVPASDEGSSEESDSEDEAGSSDESESDGEKPVKSAVMGEVKKTDSDEDSESEEDSDSDDSDDSESEAEVKPKAAKRKAEEESTPVAKKSKTEVDTSKGANLFVGNLSWNVTEEWLQEEFEVFGELSGVRIMTDRESGRSKGFGYVEFTNAEDAAKAHAEKQGAELDGRVMNVDFANARPNNNERQDNRRKSYGDSVSEPSDTLFIGNLSFDVGQDAISEAFGPHGTVLGVRLPTDRETGAPKGFGYVTFASVEEAKAAMENMQGHYLENRPVRLDYSQPRPQNNDSPRGGFGGRGRGRGGFQDRGRGGFGGRGGRGGRGDFRGGRGGARGGRGASTNRGGFGDFSGKKTTF